MRAVTLLCLSLASGCAARPALVSAPRLDGEVAISEERVHITCGEDGTCSLFAEYHGRATAPASKAAVLSRHARDVALSPRDGEEALPPSEAQALALRRDPDFGDRGLEKHAIAASVQGWHIRPRAERFDMQLRAQLEPPPPWRFYDEAPALARHDAMKRWLGLEACRYDQQGCHYRVDYLPTRLSDRALDHQVSLDVHVPPDWSMTHRGDPDEGMEVALWSGQAVFSPGGPLFGVGARLDPRVVPKVRTGWEIFAPIEVAHALVLEVDGDERVGMAITSEWMAPWLLVLPSFGAGVGLPLQLHPEVRAGARLQLSAQFPYVGALFVVDVFPSERPLITRSVFLQLTL